MQWPSAGCTVRTPRAPSGCLDPLGPRPPPARRRRLAPRRGQRSQSQRRGPQLPVGGRGAKGARPGARSSLGEAAPPRQSPVVLAPAREPPRLRTPPLAGRPGPAATPASPAGPPPPPSPALRPTPPFRPRLGSCSGVWTGRPTAIRNPSRGLSGRGGRVPQTPENTASGRRGRDAIRTGELRSGREQHRARGWKARLRAWVLAFQYDVTLAGSFLSWGLG